jgi:hypothetical protein
VALKTQIFEKSGSLLFCSYRETVLFPEPGLDTTQYADYIPSCLFSNSLCTDRSTFDLPVGEARGLQHDARPDTDKYRHWRMECLLFVSLSLPRYETNCALPSRRAKPGPPGQGWGKRGWGREHSKLCSHIHWQAVSEEVYPCIGTSSYPSRSSINDD